MGVIPSKSYQGILPIRLVWLHTKLIILNNNLVQIKFEIAFYFSIIFFSRQPLGEHPTNRLKNRAK
ncbi:hypothetical protein XNC1_0813 [Xenorhabdus nematophila ATCC 19061]|uniref:Uncharacterized protein n=1 Tax=Xenorhabdus nematophila (strain ATCC 19061 / DSM 3370 / CCUG 14189 / LMG 1036 / NCIMB 9965 / AN6) TaxID=406817 RepID=D3VKD2_XENNA|nr:hypothetical protein XNC1_0813 [Xenorhabdus nematophila ATCC 19061]